MDGDPRVHLRLSPGLSVLLGVSGLCLPLWIADCGAEMIVALGLQLSGTGWWPKFHGATFILAGQAVTVDVGKVKTQPRWHQSLGESQAGEAQSWMGPEPGEQLK
jgi:hypothetical protein